MQSTLWEDEKSKRWLEEEEIVDPACLVPYGASVLSIDKQGRAYEKGALESIVDTSGMRRGTVLAAKRSLPEFIEGSADVTNLLNEIDDGPAKNNQRIEESL